MPRSIGLCSGRLRRNTKGRHSEAHGVPKNPSFLAFLTEEGFLTALGMATGGTLPQPANGAVSV